MKNLIIVLVFFCFGLSPIVSSAQVKLNFDFDTPYGNNKSVGKYAEINGARLYYEEYGEGDPLLLIHGNGGSINWMGNQIEYFKKKYRVIIADSRGQGKSELKTDSLTYNQIAKDWEGLAKHLKLDSLSIIGWSDGGIVGLKMGINNNIRIKKIVSMAANIRPDSTAVYPWVIEAIKKEFRVIKSKIKEEDTAQNWNLKKQLLDLTRVQPNIPTSDLSKIEAKVLIVAGDEDGIKSEHSIEIYKHLQKAQLCIMPGETHFTPSSNPKLFNSIADKFLSEPFKRPKSDYFLSN